MTRFGPWIDGGIFDHAPMANVFGTVDGIDTLFWGQATNSGLIGGPTDITTAQAFWSPTDYGSLYTTAADQSGWVAGQDLNMFYAQFDMVRDPFPDWSWEYSVKMGARPQGFVAYVPWFLDPTFSMPPDAIGFEIEGGASYCTVLGLEAGTSRSWVFSDNTADAHGALSLVNATGTARLRALLAEPPGVFTPDPDLGPHYDVDWGGPSTFDAADPVIDEVDLSTLTTTVDSVDPGGTFDLTPYLYGPPEAGLFFGYALLEDFSLPTPDTTPPADESEIIVNVDWTFETPIYTVQAPRRRFIYESTPQLPECRIWPRDEGRTWPPNRRDRRGGRVGGYQ